MSQPIQSSEAVPSLYEWAGGYERFEDLFRRLYEKIPRDEMLAEVFKHMPADHFKTVAKFVAEVFGGPKFYSGDLGKGHATMVSHHLRRNLTDAQRKRWMQLLLESADELKFPDDPEFRSALLGYLEWGSRIAVMNSVAKENPIQEHAPMPSWGWGETKGPYRP